METKLSQEKQQSLNNDLINKVSFSSPEILDKKVLFIRSLALSNLNPEIEYRDCGKDKDSDISFNHVMKSIRKRKDLFRTYLLMSDGDFKNGGIYLYNMEINHQGVFVLQKYEYNFGLSEFKAVEWRELVTPIIEKIGAKTNSGTYIKVPMATPRFTANIFLPFTAQPVFTNCHGLNEEVEFIALTLQNIVDACLPYLCFHLPWNNDGTDDKERANRIISGDPTIKDKGYIMIQRNRGFRWLMEFSTEDKDCYDSTGDDSEISEFYKSFDKGISKDGPIK